MKLFPRPAVQTFPAWSLASCEVSQVVHLIENWEAEFAKQSDSGDQMDYHQHARLTVFSRELLAKKVLEAGFTLKLAAADFNVSAKTAAKWARRYRELGAAGLRDRSSRPQRLRQPTSPELVARVETLGRERWTGFRIAQQTGVSRATVSRILRRLKLSLARDLEPQPPVQRYEHAAPGDLLHLNIKKLGPSSGPRTGSPGTAGTRSKAMGVCARGHRRSYAHRLLGHLPG